MRDPDEMDDLDTYIAERDEREPGFATQHAAALSRREVAHQMAEARRSGEKSQTAVGALVGTSQAQIARLEKGDADCRISSLERYAAALGFEIHYKLVAVEKAEVVLGRGEEKSASKSSAQTKGKRRSAGSAPARDPRSSPGVAV